MRKREAAKAEESISPNLIPMIDIMFLLLLFFMLSADMSQRQLEEVVLPQASEVKQDDPNKVEGEELVTLNIHHATDKGVDCAVYANGGVCRDASHWKWAIYGHDYTQETIGQELLDIARLHMEPVDDPVAKTKLSSVKLLIRADSAAPYGDVQKVIESCGGAKIYKVEVAAAQPPAEKK
jgi:biopolymer transport protein ExbD